LAREKKPSIIFIDEIDSLCGSRSDGENDATRRVKTEFLVQMQGVGKDDEGILVLGATNIPWGLDPAIRRRFERRIYIPLPDYEGRLFLVKHNLKDTPNTITDKEMEIIAEKIDGFSGSDISIFVRDAVFEPVRKIQNANYYQEVIIDGKKRQKPVSDDMAGKPKVKQMKLIDVDPNELLIPEVSMVRIYLNYFCDFFLE
jgi:vacuolar protein-sorting-associated protein 4